MLSERANDVMPRQPLCFARDRVCPAFQTTPKALDNRHNTSVDNTTELLYSSPSDERMAILPMHGKGKELGTGLVNAIKKQLGLK